MTIWRRTGEELNSLQAQRFGLISAPESEIPEESIMKAVIIATLLGLFLSTPLLPAPLTGAADESNSSKAASGYVYVNRLDAPAVTRSARTPAPPTACRL